MEVDSEKLLNIMQTKSQIYDFKDKNHADKIYIEKLWSEIASELNCSVANCKNKWNSLRSSYCRYLREERTKSIGLNGKQRKKWYLADAMTFLKPFINPQRHSCNSLEMPDMEEYPEEIIKQESADPLSEIEQTVTNTARNSPVPCKKTRSILSEMVAGSMIEYLKTQTKAKPQENANELFFKSLHADCEKLDHKKQREFKMHMMNKMHEMLEAQENEATLASAKHIRMILEN